jgi:hypothetical protein
MNPEIIAISPDTPCGLCLRKQASVDASGFAICFCPYHQSGALFADGIWTCLSPVTEAEFRLKVAAIVFTARSGGQKSPSLLPSCEWF